MFGTTCLRCNRPLASERGDDVPTCSACAELLRAKLHAGAEEVRACPLDGEPMAKELIRDLVVDRCPACGGVWLDGGELEVLRRAIEEGGGVHLAGTVVLGMTRA